MNLEGLELQHLSSAGAPIDPTTTSLSALVSCRPNAQLIFSQQRAIPPSPVVVHLHMEQGYSTTKGRSSFRRGLNFLLWKGSLGEEVMPLFTELSLS